MKREDAERRMDWRVNGRVGWGKGGRMNSEVCEGDIYDGMRLDSLLKGGHSERMGTGT